MSGISKKIVISRLIDKGINAIVENYGKIIIR